MSDLKEVGIAGPDHLREALTNCTDPLAAIEDFQLQNGILLPSLRPALPFLDLHGMLRLEFHQSVMEELRDRLLQQIRDIAAAGNDKHTQKILNDLLTKSFLVIKVKALRPVVMCLMQHVSKIKEEYLLYVVENKEIYVEAAVEVKQQIWQDNQALFGDEVSPLLSRYIELKESMLYGKDSTATFFLSLPKTRRQEDVVQELVRMIGKNVRLYDMVLQFLRTLFLRTRNVHYCTLRSEMLMALHDADVQDIVSMDPCHKFAWCLDACIRERFVDLKRARELHAFLEAMKQSQEQVLGDLSMILCDAQAVYTIALSTMKAIHVCASTETLPRASEELQLLLRMLSMGLNAWKMIDSQVFKETKLDTSLITRFIPCIVGLIIDDQLSVHGTKTEFEPLSHYMMSSCRDDSIACTLLVHYVLSTARNSNSPSSITHVLSALPECDMEIVYSDTTLHDLVSSLITIPDHFTNTDFCLVVFDKFFMPQISKENVARHLLRLLWSVYHRISSYVMNRLIKLLQPITRHGDHVQKDLEALMEKVNSRPVSPQSTSETQDSPLIGAGLPLSII